MYHQLLSKVMSFFIFLLNPMLWSSFGFWEVLLNKKTGYIKASLFFGIIAYSLFPWGDGYERYLVYEKVKYFTLDEFIVYGLSQGDVTFYLTSYLLSQLGFPYQCVQLLSVALGCLLIFFSLRHFLNGLSIHERAVLLFITVTLIHFIALANGIRYLLATVMFLFAVIKMERGERSVGVFAWFLLSCLTHFYAIFILFVYFLSRSLSSWLSKKKIVCLLFMSLIFSSFSWIGFGYVASVVSSGGGFFERKVASYMLGGDALITKMVSSPYQLLHYLIYEMPVFVMVAFFVLHGKQGSREINTFLLLVSFSVLFLYFFSIYLRVSYFCLIYGVFVVARNWGLFYSRRAWVYLLMVSSFFFSAVEVSYFKRIIALDNVSYINDVSLCSVVVPPVFLYKCIYTDSEIHAGNASFRQLKDESRSRTLDVIGE